MYLGRFGGFNPGPDGSCARPWEGSVLTYRQVRATVLISRCRTCPCVTAPQRESQKCVYARRIKINFLSKYKATARNFIAFVSPVILLGLFEEDTAQSAEGSKFHFQ
jgi:hypothetical protein